MPSIEGNDFNSYVDSLSDIKLYTCVKSSGVGGCEERMSIDRMDLGRWEGLMHDDNDDGDDDGDDCRVWKAIDWKGNYSASVCLSAHGDGVLPRLPT